MQWCQRLDADYGVDPWIWQSLDGPSFHLSSKLCLCNSFHGCFVPKLRLFLYKIFWLCFSPPPTLLLRTYLSTQFYIVSVSLSQKKPRSKIKVNNETKQNKTKIYMEFVLCWLQLLGMMLTMTYDSCAQLQSTG